MSIKGKSPAGALLEPVLNVVVKIRTSPRQTRTSANYTSKNWLRITNIMVVSGQWSQEITVDKSRGDERLDSRLLTPGVWWQIKVNGVEYPPMPPLNSPEAKAVELPEVNSMQWRVIPNSSVSLGTIEYWVTKRY